MTDLQTPSRIVIGVDGSRSAKRAAIWAAEEAAHRAIPLRMVYVVDSDSPDSPAELASAQTALRDARSALDAARKPVPIETEITLGQPVTALAAASRSAAMICVGAIGRRRPHDRLGSTAAGLAASAHCPVAIIRGRDGANDARPGWIVVHANESPSNPGVLHRGIEVARARGAPLHVVMTWHSRRDDVPEDREVADGNRRIRAQLDRRLTPWTRRFPELDIHAVAVHGSIVDFLAEHKDSVQLAVLGGSAAGDVMGPEGYAALQHTDCSVIVIGPRRL